MSNQLKPCPFCGSEPLVNHIEPHKHSWSGMPDHPGSCVIECGCGAGLIDDTEELVSNLWNTRAEGFNTQSEKVPEPAGFQVLNSYSKNEWTGCHGFATTQEAEQCGSEWRYVYTAPPELAELKRQLAEAQKDQADAKRYKYLRDIEVMPLRVYEALESNMGKTLDMEIDYEIGIMAVSTRQLANASTEKKS